MTHLEEILSAVNELQGERVVVRTAMCCTAATPNRKWWAYRLCTTRTTHQLAIHHNRNRRV